MKTIKTLADLNREDGITSFRSEFEEHPGRVMWKEYIQAYTLLGPLEQAQHKIANSETYINYADSMKHGIHIYNQRTNGGRDALIP